MPYLISVCFDRSSALAIGDVILSTVRKAARLAVYDEIMISVKNHQMPLTIRVDTAFGAISEPASQTPIKRQSNVEQTAAAGGMGDRVWQLAFLMSVSVYASSGSHSRARGVLKLMHAFSAQIKERAQLL